MSWDNPFDSEKDLCKESDEFSKTHGVIDQKCRDYFNIDYNGDCDEILPSLLYLGDYDCSRGESKLLEKKIGVILNITCDSIDKQEKFSWIKYHQFSVEDEETEDLLSIFPKTTEILMSAYKSKIPVLVHCHAGISRSPSIVIAFLMKLRGISCNDAFDFVKKKRKEIDPSNFIQQLRKWENIVKCK